MWFSNFSVFLFRVVVYQNLDLSKCHRSWQLIRARQSKSGDVANCCKLQVKTITTPTKSVVIAAERKYNFKICCIQNLTISLAPCRISMHFSAFPHLFCSAGTTGWWSQIDNWIWANTIMHGSLPWPNPISAASSAVSNPSSWRKKKQIWRCCVQNSESQCFTFTVWFIEVSCLLLFRWNYWSSFAQNASKCHSKDPNLSSRAMPTTGFWSLKIQTSYNETTAGTTKLLNWIVFCQKKNE